jgi:hypothetical protein
MNYYYSSYYYDCYYWILVVVAVVAVVVAAAVEALLPAAVADVFILFLHRRNVTFVAPYVKDSYRPNVFNF